MADTKEKESFSNEKQHYITLISIFKYMVGAIIILAGMAVWIIGSSISDIKKVVTGELEKLNSEIVAMREESQRSIKASSEEAEKQIEHLRKNTEAFLNLTKDITAMQISTIREDAKNLALSSARLRIEEAFKANDIQLLVETAAKKEIGNRLDEIVKSEIEKTTSVFENFPLLTSTYDRIRWGDRKALDILDSMANHADNPTIKRISKGLLLQKGKDYEDSIIEEEGDKITQFDPLVKLGLKVTTLLTKADSTRIWSDLINIILDDTDLYRVLYGFLALNKLTDEELKIFDISAVRRMANHNK